MKDRPPSIPQLESRGPFLNGRPGGGPPPPATCEDGGGADRTGPVQERVAGFESLDKSVCVFDFDGTLVDSMGGFADLAAELMAEHFAMSRDEARRDYLRTSGLPFFQQLEALRPGDARNSEVAERFEAGKQADYFERPFFSEVPTAIDELRERGIRSVVSSNNGQALVERYLEKKARPRFDLVLGFRPSFSKGKAHFDKVLAHFGLEAKDMLFVGDSLHDAREAQEFGVDFVGRVGTFSTDQFQQVHPQLRTVRGLDELTRVLCR